MAGVIAAVGDKVSGWRVGDRVMAFHHIPCGKGCYYCRKKTFSQCESYKRVGCTAGFEPSGGGFAEYIRVMDWIVERGLVRIPDHVPFEQALWIEPVNTCYKAIHNLHLDADETVLVIGQGPIGILLASLARQTGATVLTSDLYASRHKVASQFDLHNPIYADKQNPIAAVKEHTEGRGADVVIVAVGANSLIRPAMDAVRFGGRVLLFAATQHGEVVIDPAAICMDEKSLIGSYSSSADVQQTASQLVLDGYPDRFNLTHLISHTFPLEKAAEAIIFASEPKPDSMKVVIQP
jgi:L-iditol 2-dehydrogenase